LLPFSALPSILEAYGLDPTKLKTTGRNATCQAPNTMMAADILKKSKEILLD